jgi:pimeloyl-ACP methyl ester carboxylesterase
VRFVLAGGHAVAGHGEPRLTEDLDVFVEPTAADARRLRDALVDFGFGGVAPAVNELAVSDKIFMLGRKPWRIDIRTDIDGVSFRHPAAPTWFVDDASDFTERLASMRIPTLVLSGDSDPLSPVRVGEFLRDHMPSAELRVVSCGAHWMAHDEPDRIADLIDRFLS